VTEEFSVSDNEKPGISTVTPSDGAVVETSSPTFSAGFSDNGELDGWRLFVDGSQEASGGLSGTSDSVSTSVSGLSDGSHSFAWNASDNSGNTKTVSGSFIVDTNIAPNASFSFTPSNPSIGEPVTFDASGSSDPDGDSLSHSWDLDGDGSYEKEGGRGVSKFSQGNGFVYNYVPGDYAEASNGNGQCSSPGGGIEIPVGKNQGQVTLDLEASTDSYGKAQVGIDHVDGFDVKTITSGSGSSSSFSGTKTYDLSGYYSDISLIVGNHDAGQYCNYVDHGWDVQVNNIDDFEQVESTTKQFSNPGSKSVTVTVSDGNGDSDSVSRTVTVSDDTNPSVNNPSPTGTVNTNSPTISADFSDNYDLNSYILELDGSQVASDSISGASDSFSYSASGLSFGQHSYNFSIEDSSGNRISRQETFTVNLLNSKPNPNTVEGALWVQSSDLRWGNGTYEFWLKDVSVSNTGISGPSGAIWIQGTEVHWIDQNSDERAYKGRLVQGGASSPKGALWFQNGFIHYIDENGDERVADGT
jgi:hypothetical protein